MPDHGLKRKSQLWTQDAKMPACGQDDGGGA